MLTESGGITQFSSISEDLQVPEEINPDKLSLALEPESAAVYSQETVVSQIDGDPSAAAINRPTEYMVIDIGGGTVDITIHREVDGGIIVKSIPTGNAWGGTKVNKEFSKMLGKILNDSGFERFLKEGEYLQKMATLNKLFYTEFESQKVLFGRGMSDKEISVTLPKIFATFFRKKLDAGITGFNGIEYDEDTDSICISSNQVESQLFGPVQNGIMKIILRAITDCEYEVNTFYLVGGFGGCKYIHQKVSAALEKLYSTKGLKAYVIVPPSPQLAVATGAVMWRKNLSKVKGRRVDATYGIGTSIPFDPKFHDEHYRYYDKAWEHDRCSDVFDVFIEKGELVKINKVIAIDLCPHSQDDTHVHISIYSTTNLGIQYIKDKDGKKTVMKIGRLVIEVPNPDNLPLEERIVDVTMDFSGTEIQAKAKYRVTGKEVKTVCDFLSTQ